MASELGERADLLMNAEAPSRMPTDQPLGRSHAHPIDADLVPWDRLWLPAGRDGSGHAAGEGFLEDWDELFGIRSAGSPRHLHELLGLRCLVLCGEPGMGKSKALEQNRAQIEANACRAGAVFWRTFREALSPEHLLGGLKGSSAWQKWLSGGELTVVIDGVDEWLALASTLLEVLGVELRDGPVDRLRLILVCRDAEWPLDQGAALMRLWPPEQVGRFQLQRLRLIDAEEAARHWGLSGLEVEAFLAAVRQKGIEPFAARPMTLRMMVDEFKTNQQLSGTRGEIFGRACLRLCKEDPARAKLLSKLPRHYEFTGDQLLRVVKKVAAWMLLGRFSAVSRTPSCSQVLGFDRLVPAEADDRDRAMVEEGLGCALFRDAGSQSRTFAHQSYAEFLASEYLSEMPLAQVLNLVCVQDGEQQFIVPQLAELSAWLALRHGEFADWLIDHEPEILVRNDASSLSESRRSLFVARLLDRMAHEKVFDDWDLERFFGSFRHAGLASQLRPYIVNSQGSLPARRAAIRLAELGGFAELLDDLLDVAKDVQADMELREPALRASRGLIPERRLDELDSFARCGAGPDPFDNLRGIALKALVPRRWKVSEALPTLAKPSNQDFIGEFHMVCAEHIPKAVVVEDLPEILRQLTDIDHPFHGHDNRIRPVACRAFALAAQNVEKREVAAAFVDLVKTKLRQDQLPVRKDDPDWKEAVEQDQSVRRQVAALLAKDGGFTAEGLNALLFYGFIRLQHEDCPWLLQALEAAPQTQRLRWVELTCSLWPNIVETTWRDDFLEACERIPELAARTGWPIATPLDCPDVKRYRERLAQQKLRKLETENRPAPPTAQQAFDDALAAAGTDWRHWPRLSSELQRAEDGRGGGITPDPMSTHRWRVCTVDQRAQVVNCARDFLLQGVPTKPKDDPRGAALHQVFWALWLTKDRLQADEGLRTAVLTKWFEVLLAQPFFGVVEEQELARLAVVLDPLRAKDNLRRRLEGTLQANGDILTVLAGFELTWEPSFTGTLLAVLDEQKTSSSAIFQGIEFLARHDRPAAQAWVETQLDGSPAADAAIVLAVALALFPSEFWQRAKSTVQTDPTLGLKSLQILADFHASSARHLEKLDAMQLADLFVLLESEFPSSCPLKIAAEEFAPRERIERLRAFAPERLQALASEEACQQLERIAKAVPHWATRLRRRLREAHLALLRKTWGGVPPERLEAMAASSHSRWVRSADDLLALVMESTARFQARLNGTEYPEVRDLWNEEPKPRPKDESALTQKLVRWLRDDLGPKNGVALGCEVEPSPVHQTDIEVWGNPGGKSPTGEQFVVTIEVKRSDSKEVATSLEQQLVREYLLKLGRTHGVYVVGWYQAEGWRAERNPLAARTWKEANAKVAELLRTAQEAHPNLQIASICLDCGLPAAFRRSSGVPGEARA